MSEDLLIEIRKLRQENGRLKDILHGIGPFLHRHAPGCILSEVFHTMGEENCTCYLER